MPHPKNHLKLTGDTHPPEVEFDLDLDLEDEDTADSSSAPQPAMEQGSAPRRSRMEARPQQPSFAQGGATERYFEAAREQVRAKPYASLGAAFAVGFLLAKLFR